jgi:hypothetical protein
MSPAMASHGACGGGACVLAGLAAGWLLFDPELGALGHHEGGAGTAVAVGSRVGGARLYTRALLVTELIGNFRAQVGRLL